MNKILLGTLFLKAVHIWKTMQSSNFILTELSSISRNVMPRESNFRMFYPRGKQGQSAKKHKCVFYSRDHCCQHDSIVLGPKEWHREREHANNCIQGFFFQTNTMSLAALFSREPRRQIDTPNLGLEEEALTMEPTV